ncbi:helix-turn-helix domain-containing protein [Streptomyces cacaoi]
MPNRRRAIDHAHPLGQFAVRLRELQEEAVARAGGSLEARKFSIDKVATGRWATSRTSIFAALNGTRLPSMNTLCAMVSAWHPQEDKGIPEWQKLRRDVEEQLIALRNGTPPAAVQVEVERRPETVRRPDTEAIKELRVRLSDALAQARMSKTQLAARSELGRTTVHEAFTDGRPVPSASTVVAIGRALRLDVAVLLELHRRAVG